MFLTDDLVFNANYTYYDAIRHPGFLINGTSPLSHRLDLTLSKKIAKGKGEIMIGVSDVFNKTAGPVFGIAEFVAHETPGRTWFARWQMNF